MHPPQPGPSASLPWRALVPSALGSLSVCATVPGLLQWGEHGHPWWVMASPALAGVGLGAMGASLAWWDAQRARGDGLRPASPVLVAGLLGLLVVVVGSAVAVGVQISARLLEEGVEVDG